MSQHQILYQTHYLKFCTILYSLLAFLSKYDYFHIHMDFVNLIIDSAGGKEAEGV